MKRKILNALPPLVVILLLGVIVFLRSRQEATSGRSKASSNATAWVKFDQCRLVNHPINDGDSFMVAHGDKTSVFRLYFVDCPETELKKINDERLKDQAAYFSLPSAEAATLVGKGAAAFTHQQLQHPFTVVTRWERVFDSQRFYAQIFVHTPDHGARDLAELLVEQGFARIHTKGANLPGNTSESRMRQHLRKLESASREEQRGAWKR